MEKLSVLLVVLLLGFLFHSCETNNKKELSFLTFNVWQEGTSVPNGLLKIRDVVADLDPDVVCFVEVRNYDNQDWTTKIIDSLSAIGRTYYRGYAGGDVSFISKHPLFKGRLIFTNTDEGTVVGFNVDIDGDTIVVAGVHLDYTYYASNLPRGYSGSDPDWKMIDDGNGQPLPQTNPDSISAYNLKSTRDESIASFLEAIKNETKPIVLMGDFNEPSWFDWTENTKKMFDHNGAVVPWETTRELANQGFTDAYRELYPNEVTHPGFTWPAYAHEKKSTSWTPLADERDRIDFIFYKGDKLELIDASMVGPRECYVYNKLDTANTGNEIFLATELPWPTDHKAVLVTLQFTVP